MTSRPFKDKPAYENKPLLGSYIRSCYFFSYTEPVVYFVFIDTEVASSPSTQMSIVKLCLKVNGRHIFAWGVPKIQRFIRGSHKK